MKALRIVLFVALVAAGCVPSWNAFYTEKDLVFDESLVGSWIPSENNNSNERELWVFSRDSDKSYLLSQTDDEGRKARFKAHLFKLGEGQYMDLYFEEIEEPSVNINALAGSALIPAHLLLKVEQAKPLLKLAVMNPDWLQKFLKANPGAITHKMAHENNVILGASTADLQKFVLEHARDPDFFGGAVDLKRKPGAPGK